MLYFLSSMVYRKYFQERILSARFFARNTTDDAAMFTPNEIKNSTMPMKNSV